MSFSLAFMKKPVPRLWQDWVRKVFSTETASSTGLHNGTTHDDPLFGGSGYCFYFHPALIKGQYKALRSWLKALRQVLGCLQWKVYTLLMDYRLSLWLWTIWNLLGLSRFHYRYGVYWDVPTTEIAPWGSTTTNRGMRPAYLRVTCP